MTRLAQKRQPNAARYRQVSRTRFQDELFVPLEPILESSMPYPEQLNGHRQEAAPALKRPDLFEPASPTTEATMTYWLSNGQKKLPCVVSFQQQQGQYQLKLEYRGTASTTAWHNTLDAAQTELDAILARHGLRLLEPSSV